MTALSRLDENTEELRDDTTTSVSKSICSYSLLRYNYTSIYATFRELRHACHPRPPGRRVSCRPDCAGAAGLVAGGRPPGVYTHPKAPRLERERLLKPSWQIACHISQIGNAGDYVTFELGSDSVIVLREREGGIRALRNVCRHRGTRLLEGAGRCHGRITCPYHGWTYRYDGSLLATPAKESFPDLNLREHGLDAVRVELALGFVFVCLAAEAPPPPSEMWAPIIEELAPYRLEELVPTQPVYFEQWDVDWKIAMDNYLESYHVPVGHPGLNRMFTPDYEDQRGVPGIARGISWMREAPSSRA